MEQVKANFPGDLLVVTRHRPAVSAASFPAAVAAEAAARQGMFEEYSQRLYDEQQVAGEWRSLSGTALQDKFNEYAADLGLDMNQFISDMADPALTARVQRDLDAAAALGVGGTPTFFVNGTVTPNPGSAAGFTPIIEMARDAVDDAFSLNRQTGQIRVRDSTALNPDTDPLFLYNVSVADESGFTETVLVAIEVNPVP